MGVLYIGTINIALYVVPTKDTYQTLKMGRSSYRYNNNNNNIEKM